MAITKIDRKMNCYEFHFDRTDRTVKIDLDKKGEAIVGVSGKVLKNEPKNIMDYRVGQFILEMYYNTLEYDGNNNPYKEILDRCISLNMNINYYNQVISYYYYGYGAQYILDNWKSFIIYSKIADKFDLNKFKRYNQFEELKKMYKEDMVNIFKEIDYVPDFYIKDKEYRHEIKYIYQLKDRIKEFNKNLPNEDIMKLYGWCWSEPNYRNNITEAFRKVKEIYSIVEQLQIKDFKPNKIDEDYQKLVAYKNKYQAELDDKFFKNLQEKRNLYFENEKYYTIIPKTREELREFGNKFHNCLNGWEWDNKITARNYSIAIVVNKETKICLVCCDICPDNKIEQYLAPYNRSVTTFLLQEFKNQYQEYLNTLDKIN